ncbi:MULTISPECIES: DNA-3-methyladenine glycosylase I [Rhodobacterales]|uniref:DNA-3-methyladenine glycosylase I n=1 Tax=Roseobacter sp. N2S TaxID=2663844 RepID=UPI002860A86B|nr:MULTISPECIES: DNA-3-methyladenine glycosylase I [Rhodobacterales]MDR6263701.1 DNA-3-methyladenine glycosylase I [Roseobacter sp. N2S]
MEKTRCDWCGSLPIYVNYHDEEWGVPEYDSRALWEKLVLDGFQAGLSWLTILKKRDAFRSAFAEFNPEKVAAFTQADVQRLLGDAGIIRHRGKIEAAISGAQAWIKLEERQGFDALMWDYVGGQPLVNRFETMAQVPPSTEFSERISKDLKKLGFKFCGPTIVYAWMEATGLINDHLITCHRHEEVARLAR